MTKEHTQLGKHEIISKELVKRDKSAPASLLSEVGKSTHSAGRRSAMETVPPRMRTTALFKMTSFFIVTLH